MPWPSSGDELKELIGGEIRGEVDRFVRECGIDGRGRYSPWKRVTTSSCLRREGFLALGLLKLHIREVAG